MTLKLGMQHRVLKYYEFYSNDDAGLTMTYFRARSNLGPYAFVWEKKVKQLDCWPKKTLLPPPREFCRHSLS